MEPVGPPLSLLFEVTILSDVTLHQPVSALFDLPFHDNLAPGTETVFRDRPDVGDILQENIKIKECTKCVATSLSGHHTLKGKYT